MRAAPALRYRKRMISFAEARRLVGLTQRQLAGILGVTQPAVAAYESGRRPLGRAAAAWLAAVTAAQAVPSRSHGIERGRSIDLPSARWTAAVDPGASVELPTRLDWSPRRQPARDLSDPVERGATYAQVLEEGSPADIAVWVDLDALAELWPDVPIARHLVGPVGEMLAALDG